MEKSVAVFIFIKMEKMEAARAKICELRRKIAEKERIFDLK